MGTTDITPILITQGICLGLLILGLIIQTINHVRILKLEKKILSIMEGSSK